MSATPAARGLAAARLIAFLWQRRRTLVASVRHEFANRYSGSLLGLVWVVLFPLAFLSIYAIVYTLVFRVRLAEGGVFDYVLYVFCGLVPYLAMIEAANQSASSIRNASSEIRGSLLPVEMVPARVVGVAMVSMLVGVTLIIVMSLLLGRLSPNALLLPAVIAVHACFFLGLACTLAVLGALIRDVSYIVSLSAIMFLFLSPIAYTSSMLPPVLWFLRDLNPVYYIVEAYRMSLFRETVPDWPSLAIFVAMSIGLLCAGAAILRRYKGIAADNA